MIRATMLACALAGLSLRIVAAEPDVPMHDLRAGMSLPSALAAFNERGFRIVYSSALVREDMRLEQIPDAASVDEFLRALLAPWNLTIVSDGSGDRLIVRNSARGSPHRMEAIADVDAIEAVDVTASRYGLATDVGAAVFLDRNDVQRTPHLADDPMRMLKLLPGVTGGDYSAALNIRGGRRDETLLTIDGAEIHNGFHFRDVDGFLSVLDTHLVQSVDFITGGMTADYGNYMSGVVDLTTFRPAPDDEYRSMLGISFVSAYGRTGGTFAEGDGSWLIAARRGYLDLVLSNAQPDGEQLTPRYSDVFAAATYDFGADTSLGAYALLDSDDLRLISNDDEDVDSAGAGRSGHVWMTLDRRWSDSLRVHTLVGIARLEQTRDSSGADDERTGAVDSDFQFRYLDFRQDWSWSAGSNHLLRFGFNANRQEANYDYHLVASIDDPTERGETIDIVRNTDLDATGSRFGIYASWRSRLARNLTAEAGVRWDEFQYPHGMSYDVVSPRLNLLYAVGERGELRASWSVMHQPQGIDQLQVEDGLTDFFPPERSTQSVLSYTQRFGAGMSARLDVYDKEYANQRPRFENALDPIELIPEATIDRIRIDAPSAQARGIELTVRREAEAGFAGWASAAYAHVRDWIDETWIPRSWEQELTFSFGASWSGALWSVNVAGLYHTGTPITALTAVGDGDGVAISPAYNAARLGPYSRIDLRVNRDVLTRAGRLSWYLEVTNLFDSRNPCCIEDFGIDPRNSSNVLIEDGYWMPRLPSFGFQWEF